MIMTMIRYHVKIVLEDHDSLLDPARWSIERYFMNAEDRDLFRLSIVSSPPWGSEVVHTHMWEDRGI